MTEARVIKAFMEGRHTQRDPVEVTVGATATLLLPRNPNRTQVVIVNNSGGAGATRTARPLASVAGGTRIEVNGIQTFRVDRDGNAVGSEWYALTGTPGAFTVTEWVADA